MLLLIVAIGTLNVCLGAGLAMYYGYGPPGLDGILQALGPMPPATPDAAPAVAGGLGATDIPSAIDEVPQSASNGGPAASLSEEGVLNDVRDLNAAAESALASGAAQTR